MFSFHKPKVYRSTQGCCICKAKSSSSRFTDSKKYETDFEECFLLIEPRQGEICNACVLLVKRFKRLAPGHKRHWSHVVDARIGPGIKSMTKFKKRKEEQMQSQNGSTEFAGQSNTNAQNIRNNTVTERFGKIMRKIQKKKAIATRSCDENSQPTSPSSSSDNEENRMSDDASDRLECDEDMSSMIGDGAVRRSLRKQKNPTKNQNNTLPDSMHVIDAAIWEMRRTCCGYVYESKKFGAILIDQDKFSELKESCPVHAKKVPSECEKKEELMKLPSVIKSLPLKKQHFLRQCIIDATPVIEPMEQSAPIDYSKATTNQIAQQLPNTQSTSASSNIHKVRGDSGKVAKKAPKKKISDLSAVKNLVKLCTSNKLANAMNADSKVATNVREMKYREQIVANEHNENKNITNTTKTEPIVVNKYSDNSSDSGIEAGYDETLHDATQLNQIVKIGTTRPVILSNGVKLHVKPENLLLAANLAGVSQTAIQTTQANMKAISAQKFQKSPLNGVSSMAAATTTTAASNYNKGVYVVNPSALTVTNNS